ncbi:hypothetical protein D3C76_1471680 [compost metagenome]
MFLCICTSIVQHWEISINCIHNTLVINESNAVAVCICTTHAWQSIIVRAKHQQILVQPIVLGNLNRIDYDCL